ncbi:MAG: D-alanine--D-alanine ligase [Hyphomicrobiaceae bacterium]|nr:D-alanine--D-alanine ligase [Hyphomicrobiaceae bacterium]
MTEKYSHVAVLMGGLSAERTVSLSSGKAVAKALEGEGYRVSLVDVGADLAERLTHLAPDVCFNALHGKWGEDGCVQGVLEVLNMPYTHSGVLASSVAMNKALTKILLANAGVPVAKSIVVSRKEAAKGPVMATPYVLKPVADGSSVGIFIVMTDKDHPGARLMETGEADDQLMAEQYIAGREFTCSVMEDKALGVTEIEPGASFDFYDFDSKYEDGGSKHTIPAKISSDLNAQIESYAVTAHKILGCRGISRSDFRFDEETNTLACLEINTQPGMTATSLAPEQAVYSGMTFGELVHWLVEDASCNR